MKSRVIFLLFILFFLFTSVFAASKKVIWAWGESDNRVMWYRYQINKMVDLDNAWTYIPNIPDKRYVMITPTDDVTEYVLYIQSSYDGISWSEAVDLLADTTAYKFVTGE